MKVSYMVPEKHPGDCVCLLLALKGSADVFLVGRLRNALRQGEANVPPYTLETHPKP